MARPGFKRRWSRIVPRHLERSTVVWFAAVLVIIIVQFWQPINGDLWNVSGVGFAALSGISLFGFLAVPAASFLTDHFELFGLRQSFQYALNHPNSKPEFKERSLYRKMRHPMMLAFLIGFWATPHMTVGHFLFAALMSCYILVGIYFEERDLSRTYGIVYREFQMRVPKLLPLDWLTNRQTVPLRKRVDTLENKPECRQ